MSKVYSRIEDVMNEIKLEAIEKILRIKINVIDNLEPTYYLENLDKVRNLEEEYINMVYNYIEIKEKMLLSKDKN